jgi:hypothetical protein
LVGGNVGLCSADRLLEGGDDLIEPPLFHPQQAAEKAPKLSSPGTITSSLHA